MVLKESLDDINHISNRTHMIIFFLLQTCLPQNVPINVSYEWQDKLSDVTYIQTEINNVSQIFL